MEAKELRIGNYVNAQIGKDPVSQIEITASGIMDLSCNGDKSSIRYSPIPITEKWLIDFGGEKDDDNWGDIDWAYNIPSQTTRYYGVIRIGEVYKFGFEHMDYCTEIKYIHQLQNLYYALTGTELTRKENE